MSVSLSASWNAKGRVSGSEIASYCHYRVNVYHRVSFITRYGSYRMTVRRHTNRHIASAWQSVQASNIIIGLIKNLSDTWEGTAYTMWAPNIFLSLWKLRDFHVHDAHQNWRLSIYTVGLITSIDRSRALGRREKWIASEIVAAGYGKRKGTGLSAASYLFRLKFPFFVSHVRQNFWLRTLLKITLTFLSLCTDAIEGKINQSPKGIMGSSFLWFFEVPEGRRAAALT